MSYQALLFCPDEKTARVVTQVLTDLEFSVEACSEPFAAVKKLMAQHFDAIVVDCDNEQNATLLFKSARNSGSNQSALAVAVVEGQSGVAKAFRIGANLVLTKPINVEQSKGTLRVARGLLRKADSSKPATTATPVAAQPAPAFKPARPAAPAPVAPKPSFNGFPAQRTLIEPTVSDATSSAFELQQDPTPSPDSTEAALLESMSDSIASQRSAQPVAASSSSKEYPWQPVSKPLAEPMASSLKRAAAAVSKPEPVAPVPTKSAGPQAPDTAKFRPAAHGMPSAHGSASAPAPAREVPRPAPAVEPTLAPVAANFSPADLDAMQTEPTLPSASAIGEESLMFSAMQDGQKASGGSKKIFVIGILAMAAIAGAYYYLAEHPENAPAFLQKTLNKQTVPGPIRTQTSVPVQPQASAPVQTPTPAATTVTPAPTSDQAANSESNPQIDTDETNSETSHPVAETKPSAAKTAPGVNTKTAVSTPAPEKKVLAVAKSTPAAKSQMPAAEIVQPPPPSVLGVSSDASEKEIAGIASAAISSMPKAMAPETLKISQGVTQGLLIKRVPPSYPPTAKQMHIQGTVQLEASIGKNGNVTNVKALSGDPLLAHSAIDAVKQWKYKPYTLNNEPVEIQTQITVNFKLP
jgi:TonB family protein